MICEHCRQELKYTTLTRQVKEKIDGKEIEYEEEYAICKLCGKEVYVGELHDRNLKKINVQLGYIEK